MIPENIPSGLMAEIAAIRGSVNYLLRSMERVNQYLLLIEPIDAAKLSGIVLVNTRLASLFKSILELAVRHESLTQEVEKKPGEF